MAGFVVTPENTLNIQHRRVLNAYFAERKKDVIEYETTQDTYTVKKGDYLGKIAQKKNTTVAKIKQDNNLTSDNIKIGDTLTISSEKEKGRQVNFKKRDEAHLGDEVYVIVETLNLQDQTIWLNVKQGQTEQPDIEFESKGLMLQHDKGENTRAEAVVGAFAEDEQITNKDDFKDWAIFKFILGGKDTKREQEVLEKLTDWFELKKGCDCGKSLKLKFKCVKYTGNTETHYGPAYFGSVTTQTFDGWDNLIEKKLVTETEKEIIIAVTKNEGKLDAIQSYDSEILSAGAIQKTINIKGKGELPKQVDDFKNKYPEKFNEYFSDCGWKLENGNKMFYISPNTNEKLEGNELKKKIREGFESSTYKQKLECKLLEPIVKAFKDIDFQSLQIIDAKNRLNKVLNFKPKDHNYKISSYFKSKLGRATVLDHHINRPSYVKTDLGKALDNFFSEKDKEIDEFNKKEKDKTKHKSKISRNPNEWGDKHTDYETEILDDYGKNRRMSKSNGVSVAPGRYNHLKTEL